MSTDRTTEMLNYLSAISREVGEMRVEMNARLDRLEIRLDHIESRFDKLEADVKEIRRDIKLLREDAHRLRLDHEETKERVAALEVK